jgi:putative transposase
VRRMCQVLGVSRSGYYTWRQRRPSARQEANEALVEHIRAIHAESDRTYGSPRVHAELLARGKQCNRKRVERLMREHHIQARHRKRRRPRTTDSNHRLPVAPNVLNREFETEAPDKKWVTDITYIPTGEGWLYLAAVMDLCSRRIVGWSMACRLTSKLVKDALKLAVAQRQPAPGLLHHSDRGSQYASADYRVLLKGHGMVASMSRKGNCYDNAQMESFFGTLKTERVHHYRYRTRAEARQDIFHYIEIFYNRKRRHSALGYTSPAQFEQSLHMCVNRVSTKWGEPQVPVNWWHSDTVAQ